MENDCELLEYAAKAAGLEATAIVPDGIPHRFGGGYWNPLTDDGDALRLAVKLKINLQFSGGRYSVSKRTTFDVCCLYENEDQMIDIRRAIVRAAAEIGKAMG